MLLLHLLRDRLGIAPRLPGEPTALEQIQREPNQIKPACQFDGMKNGRVGFHQCARAENGRENEDTIAEDNAANGAVGGTRAVLPGNAQAIQRIGAGDENNGNGAENVLV